MQDLLVKRTKMGQLGFPVVEGFGKVAARLGDSLSKGSVCVEGFQGPEEGLLVVCYQEVAARCANEALGTDAGR
jgi:hypothetical protein